MPQHPVQIYSSCFSLVNTVVLGPQGCEPEHLENLEGSWRATAHEGSLEILVLLSAKESVAATGQISSGRKEGQAGKR